MRVVIEGIEGKELVLLMYILERLEFEGKEELMGKWAEFLKGEPGRETP